MGNQIRLFDFFTTSTHVGTEGETPCYWQSNPLSVLNEMDIRKGLTCEVFLFEIANSNMVKEREC